MNDQVFISYSHEDENFAKELEDTLNKKKIQVWRDNRIPNGVLWRPLIDTKLKECSLIVVIISPASMTAAYVTYEWCYAWLHLKKHLSQEIYWICLEEPSLMKGMFARLSDFNLPLRKCLMGSPNRKDDLKEIVDEICNRLQEFSSVEEAGNKLRISGDARDALRPDGGLRKHLIEAVNQLGDTKQHKSRARDYLHEGIQILLAGDPDGVVMEAIARALSNVGDASSLPYLWLAYNSQQVEEYHPARHALFDVMSSLARS